MPLFFYTLYIEGEGGTTAGEGEAIVRVHITDANDNRPEFEVDGGELVAAVPTTAEYGHLVTKVQVGFLFFLTEKSAIFIPAYLIQHPLSFPPTIN